MEKKKNKGLIIALIIFGVLALGSLTTGAIGALLDSGSTETSTTNSKPAQPPKNEEPNKEEAKPEKDLGVTIDQAKSNFKKFNNSLGDQKFKITAQIGCYSLYYKYLFWGSCYH